MADGSENLDVTQMLERRMSYLNQRQAVLSENVANSDTPGYKARDLAPLTFGDALNQASIGMAITDPKHIVPPSMAGVNSKTVQQDSSEVLPTGNSVDLSQQMMNVSQTAVSYQGITSIYKAIHSMFKIALTGSS